MTDLWIDYWKVLVISGTYYGEPQPRASDQSHTAAAADINDAEADASDKPKAKDNAGAEKDISSKQGDKTEAEAQRQNDDEDDAENTNNNAIGDSEDGEFTKKHSKSSKYLVTPQPPTSQLVLVIYGDLGKTGLLPLTAENPQDVAFEAGQPDEFKVSQHISHKPLICAEL